MANVKFCSWRRTIITTKNFDLSLKLIWAIIVLFTAGFNMDINWFVQILKNGETYMAHTDVGEPYEVRRPPTQQSIKAAQFIEQLSQQLQQSHQTIENLHNQVQQLMQQVSQLEKPVTEPTPPSA